MAAIFFDTDCELWYTEADELGVNVIKMPYTIDDEEYFYDLGRGYDYKHFFQRMREGAMPITSALNPQQYTEIFEPYFAKGEEILYISFSSQLSGTFGHLETALKDLNARYPGVKFTRFDTKNFSAGAGIMVWKAVKFYQAGHTIDETVAYLEELSPHISTHFMASDLNHLHRGGRLSKAAAVMGTMLGIKPLIRVNDEGKLEVYEKAKGEKKVIASFLNSIAEKGSELDDYPIIVLDADNPELGDKLVAKIHEAYPNVEIWHHPVGPVIGTHCGPDLVGLIFHSTHR
jgi:DegV family protein with EDD domain